jgi:KAP-like P-loop domain-containing protein
MPNPLSIVADMPLPDPRLGFDRYASALADAIRGGQPPQFTIGIYGPWGSGKSSLLNAIMRNLETDPDILPVFFDAWRYERADHIVVPLLHSVDRAIQARATSDVKQKVKDALLSVVRSLTISMGPLTIDPARALDAPASERDLGLMNEAFTRPYQDMQNISTALAGRRIVVMIDDLDRCSSEKVVSTLEAINLVMDVPGFVFVLALDYDVLVRAVVERYPHASGHVFIEKMVQVPVRVPRIDVQPDRFLPDLLPGWDAQSAGLPAAFVPAVYDVASRALEFNPRQIKRLVNSMLVLLRVAGTGDTISVDVRLLAGVVGLQLRWPNEYRDFADSVFSDDEAPVRSLNTADSEELRGYADIFFAKDLSSASLRPILSLTSVVAEPAEFDESAASYKSHLPGSAEDVRKDNLARITAELINAGFIERFPNAHYNDQIPGVRVKIGKSVVRVEGRGRDGRWHLGGDSFLLTTGADAAIQTIKSRQLLVARGVVATRGSYGGLDSPLAGEIEPPEAHRLVYGK